MTYLSEKLCLKWNDFQHNTTSFHQNLREDTDFSDVTLVGDDNLQMEDHRILLCASSPFFNTVLKKNKHSHPIIYMRGIKTKDLAALLDFIYNGEANIYQEDLDGFMTLAEELQLKGMERCKDDTPGEAKHPLKTKTKQTKPQALQTVKQEVDSKTEVKISNQVKNDKLVAVDDDKLLVSADITVEDLRYKLDSLMEKVNAEDNIWKCTVCGKETQKNTARKNLRVHVETHIEGLSYPCNQCDTINRTSATSRMHSKSHRQGQ